MANTVVPQIYKFNALDKVNVLKSYQQKFGTLLKIALQFTYLGNSRKKQAQKQTFDYLFLPTISSDCP